MKSRVLAVFSTIALISAGLAVFAAVPASADACTISGTGAPDILAGTKLSDTICADAGADLIRAKGGGDVIFAGDGDDKIAPGEGDDFIWGEVGTHDLVQFTGATGPITADLSASNAIGQGDDTLNGVEDLAGATYGDDLTGDGGDNKLTGGGGGDTLNGGVGGDDMLVGGAGDDMLDAGDGAGGDTIQGGADNDTCYTDPGDTVRGCETINPPGNESTTTDVNSSNDPSVLFDSVIFTATVSSGGPTPTGSVDFYIDTVYAGTDALDGAGQAEVDFQLGLGSHDIYADYTGDTGFDGSTSSTISTTVGTGPDCANFQLTNVSENADIRGCDLTDAVLGPQSWQGTDARGAILTDGAFGGNKTNVDFGNVQADGAFFTGLTNGADFTYANLTNAYFGSADLTGATNMDSATLAGVTWDGTVCPDGSYSVTNGDTCIGHL